MTRREARLFIESLIKLRDLAADEVALQVPNLYPTWKVEKNYQIGERVLYNEVLYKVLQDHLSQETWTPDVSISLFAKVLNPNETVIPEWERPESTNAYMIGDKVKYNGKTYVSLIDYNVYSPDTYPAGWEEIIE